MVRSHPSCSVSQGRCWPVPLSRLPIFKVGHAGAQRVHSTHQKTQPGQTEATGSNQSRQVTW